VSVKERLGWMDPAAPGATVGRIGRLEPSPVDRLQRAVARFNSSEAPRMVAGLTRTLGSPLVSVGAVAGSGMEVRVTVAWELCWYQWGVALGEEGRPVFEIARGEEIVELDGSARQWNATVGRGGRVTLSAGSRWQG
jgi:hypothetical protein